MSTSVAETSVEVVGPGAVMGGAKLRGQIVPDDAAQVLDQRPEGCELDRLNQKNQRCECPEGKDATLYIRLSNAPAPAEKQMDIPSLQSKLSSLLPRERQLERRTRKLAWQLSKGKRVTCDWDDIFLSELTPAESSMSDDDFATLYPDQVKTPTKKGGRPRKYRSAVAQKRAHAERQQRYRERKLVVVADVTKTPSQLAER